jgi:hypothetical protein
MILYPGGPAEWVGRVLVTRSVGGPVVAGLYQSLSRTILIPPVDRSDDWFPFLATAVGVLSTKRTPLL